MRDWLRLERIMKLYTVLFLVFFVAYSIQTEEDALEYHNEVRAKINPPAIKPLIDLRLDSTLASVADYFNNIILCDMKHSDKAQRRAKYVELGGELGDVNLGENVYKSKGMSSTGAMVRASELWANEKQYYNFDDNSCMEGEQCGHYTQMVWNTTQNLGCSKIVCGEEVLVRCIYGPGGNYIGQQPYEKDPNGDGTVDNDDGSDALWTASITLILMMCVLTF